MITFSEVAKAQGGICVCLRGFEGGGVAGRYEGTTGMGAKRGRCVAGDKAVINL